VDEAGQLSRAEYYQFIKQQIDHQDNLVNQRVIWQIIAQAFFFSAYTSLMNAPKESKGPIFDAEQRLLLWLLPLAGFLAGLLTYVGILSSLKTIDYLRKLYDEYSHGKAPKDSSSRLYPPIPRAGTPPAVGKRSAYPNAHNSLAHMAHCPGTFDRGRLDDVA
jgi:hypothetical protein